MKRKSLLLISFLWFLLIGSLAYSATEDLTTWTNENTNCNFTITAAKISYASGCSGNIRGNSSIYFGHDYGAGYFGNYDHDYRCSIGWNLGVKTVCWGVGDNSTGTFTNFNTVNDGIVAWATVDTPSSPDEARRYLRNFINDSEDFSATSNTYFTSERTATTIKLFIYSDSARTSLTDTLSVTHSSNTFRYAYVSSMGGSESSSALVTGYTENLDFNEDVSTFKPFAISY